MKLPLFISYLFLSQFQQCGALDNKADHPLHTSKKNVETFINEMNEGAPFLLVSATKNKWVVGLQGGGEGVDYELTLKLTSDQRVSFDSLWVDDVLLRAYYGSVNTTGTVSSNPNKVGLRKGDRVIVTATKNNSVNSSKVMPDKFKGYSLLYYQLNGKRQFFIINKMLSKPTALRP